MANLNDPVTLYIRPRSPYCPSMRTTEKTTLGRNLSTTLGGSLNPLTPLRSLPQEGPSRRYSPGDRRTRTFILLVISRYVWTWVLWREVNERKK